MQITYPKQPLQHRKSFKFRISTFIMNKWMELLVGLLLVIIAVVGGIVLPSIGQAALTFLKGGIFWIVVIAGLLFLMLGISDLKE
jgi:hypothetical protein